MLVFFIILGIIIAILVVLYILGRRLQKKQDEQRAMLDTNKQVISMLIIDKKKMKMKDAQLPANIMEQIPKRARGMKVPLAKVKAGPQIMTMFVDPPIFDVLPVKKEVKAEVSGMYIVGVKGVHGTTLVKKEKKKKGKFKQAVEKAQEKAGATTYKKK